MKYNFILFFSIILILSSFSAANAAELSNMTEENVLSLEVSRDKSIELSCEDEKKSKLIQNKTISDFNNSEYTINETDLSSNLINLDTNNMDYTGLLISHSNDMRSNLKSSGVPTSGETVNLIKTNTYTAIYNNNLNSNPSVKYKYDLRDDGYVSSIKKQVGNSCWAHAALSSLESCILKSTGVEYDFSEVKLSNMADEYLGAGGDRNGRGNILMSMGYINSWLGTVKENSNSNDPIINVQNIYRISSDNFERNVKEAILKYGAVVANYHHDDNYLKDKNYYCYYNHTENHAITIIGWDDNYNKNNFKNTPGGNGAWICKNSQGSQWGDKGYFYLSYYDKTLNKELSYTFILNDSTKYNKIYQYEVQSTGQVIKSEGYTHYKNIFTSTENENLVAISSYFYKNTNYKIQIYVGNELKSEQYFKSNINGYFTVKLNNNGIKLTKSQKFEVVIYDPSKSLHVCARSEITKILPTGASYVSKDGKTWGYAENIVCCIKAFSTTSTNLKNRYDLTSSGLTKFYGNSQPLTVTFKTYDGGSQNNVKIKFKINGVEYTRTTNANGYTSIGINLNSGGYTVPISLTNNFKQINVKITIKPTIVGSDIIKYYKNGTQYSVTCYDSNGNLLRSTTVQFNINGVFYTRTTNANGVAVLNINLEPQNYIITAQNMQTTEKCSNNIKVLTILEAKDLKKKYGSADQFKVTLLDGTGKPYAGQTITFNVNGVFYYRVTKSDGVASLNINLLPGTYVVTASYNGLNIARNIIVTP